MSRGFEGMRVLITGAGAGIGRLLSLRFASAGATVLVTARRIEAAEEVVEAIRAAGGEAYAYRLDVTESADIPQLRETVLAERGPIDVLINNAGVVQGGAFDEVPLADHFATMEVNVLGAMAMTHAFLPDLLSRPRAHLVNIASAAGFLSLPFGSSYAASKWALVGFSDSLRLELAMREHKGVKVTTVCPSYVDTGMFHGVKPPLGVPMLTPERLVGQIMRAVSRGKPMLQTPFLVNLVELGKGILPRFLWDIYARLTGISTSMVSWRGKNVSLSATSSAHAISSGVSDNPGSQSGDGR